MTHLSFANSKLLKERGFPQPEFQFGQLWMSEDERHFAFVGTPNMEQLKQYYAGRLVFLPTAIDILAEIPGAELWNSGGKMWVVSVNDVVVGSHKEEAVKAAAIAWLEMK